MRATLARVGAGWFGRVCRASKSRANSVKCDLDPSLRLIKSKRPPRVRNPDEATAAMTRLFLTLSTLISLTSAFKFMSNWKVPTPADFFKARDAHAKSSYTTWHNKQTPFLSTP